MPAQFVVPSTPGTYAWYQGIGLADCSLSRARGWTSSPSTVEISAAAFPAIAPAPLAALFDGAMTLIEAPAPSPPPVAAADQPPPDRVLPPTTTLSASGTLALAYVAGDGTAYPMPPVELWWTRAEAVRSADGASVIRVRLTLADARYFWARGLLRRWSFNRVLPNRQLAADSLGEDGKPLPRAIIAAQEVCQQLAGRPILAAYPRPWDDDRSPLEFPVFGRALEALAALAQRDGLEEPCLRWDGTMALHAAGDGALGYAPRGLGANLTPFPGTGFPALDKAGQGRGDVLQPGHPEELVLVVGSDRVATVAIDDWQPVLVLTGGSLILPLTEKVVRDLTDGNYGLEWLARFVLQPAAYQANPSLDPNVADLLAEQAWRLWRLPGAVVEAVAAPAVGAGLLSGGLPEGPALQVGTPGPNAHLLPLQARAETHNGRRLAPTVECYTFTTEHVALRGSPGASLLRVIKEELRAIVGSSAVTPTGLLPGVDFSGVPGNAAPTKNHPLLSAGDVLRDDGTLLAQRGVSLDELQGMLDRVHAITQTGAPPGTTAALLDLTRRQIAAEAELGADAGRLDLFDAARLIDQAEGELHQGVLDALLTVHEDTSAEKLARAENEAIRVLLLDKIRPLLTKAQQDRSDQAKLGAQTGSKSKDQAFGLTVLSNRPKASVRLTQATSGESASTPVTPPRAPDLHAQVIDPEAGIVRTSSLAGWVFPDGTADPSDAFFVPRPVRVIFGATIRPRIDQPPAPIKAPTPPKQATGTATSTGPVVTANDVANFVAFATAPGGQNVVPAVLSDRETPYVAAFQRAGRGVPQDKALADVALDRAVRVDDPELAELVYLDGSSNADDLRARAALRAAQRMSAPDQVPSQRLVLAHPWPVNCDGVVASVEITMRHTREGVPCGFETLITTGTGAAPVRAPGQTALRGAPAALTSPRAPVARAGSGASRTGSVVR